MTRHVKFDSEDQAGRLDEMVQGVIGTPMDRPEGPLKVSGAATYAAEWHLDRLVHGVLVRGTATAGRVRSLDTADIEALPGVLAVIDAQDMPRNPAQGGAGKAPRGAGSRIDYFGQPIALVVAETFEQARHGAQRLRASIDKTESFVDPEAVPSETPRSKQSDQGNLDSAVVDAAFVIDSIYRTPGHSSAPMEPHAAIAEWRDGSLLLRGSYQMLKYNRAELSDALGIGPDKVRIVAPYVGGGFGSKLGISIEAVAASMAARVLERPVSVTLSRQQVFEATMRRSETRQRIRLAADETGLLTGIGHEFLVSNLEGESFSEPVAQATHFLYGAGNRRIEHHIARVNRLCAGSVRAPGEAVGVLAIEAAMDELAEAAGIDPVELRLRNIPSRDPEKDIPFSSPRLAETLREGARRFGWEKRAAPGARREGDWLIGMGVAAAIRVNMLAEAKARIVLGPDGTALVETDMTDIGTGTYAILTQIAAEMLGLPPSAVRVVLGDTDLPEGPGSGGSWGASSSGASVYLACEEVRLQLAARLGCEETAMTLKDGHVIAGNRSMPISEAMGGGALVGEGHIQPGKAAKAVRQASYGAHFVEVAVDAVTGETRVRRMLGCFAAGRILNEKTARSQCIGGMTWGIGMALTEELQFDSRDGHLVNRDLAEYHVPVHADVPRLEVHFIEDRDAWAGPTEAKGIGELGICGAAAAVTNAIYNACGVRVRDLPATLDKILLGLA